MDGNRILTLPVGMIKASKVITLSTGSSANSLIDLKIPDYGGGFSYSETDIQLCNYLKRRFLLWRVSDEYLDIEEHSLDVKLLENSLRFQFKNDIIMDGVTVASSSGRVYILVPTFSVAQRICISCNGGPKSSMSMPDTTASFGVFDRGGGMFGAMSILSSININDISSVQNCYILTANMGSATLHTATAALSSNEEALFAYGYTDGSIILITMAAYEEDGPTTQDIFSQTSTVRRILTGFMSPFGRNETLGLTTPSSLAFHVLSEDVLLHANGFDQKLRTWSCRQKELVCVTDIASQITSRLAGSHVDGGNKWRVKTSTDKESPFFILYTSAEGVSQFLVFCMAKQGRQRTLVKILEFEAPEVADLLDFELSDRALYTLWIQNGTTILRWKELNLSAFENFTQTPWNSDILSLEYRILQDGDFDDSQLVIEAMFNSRIFCFEVIVKAIKMCSKNFFIRSSATDWNRLKNDFEAYVENLTKEEAASMSFSKSNVGSKAKFLRSVWSCCLQYDQECRKPISLLHCPNVELYGALLSRKVAFLNNVTNTVPEILASKEGITPALQSNVTDCFVKINQLYAALPQLDRTFDANVFDQNRSSWVLVKEQVAEILVLQESAEVQRSVSAAEHGLGLALKLILNYLDRSEVILTELANVGHSDSDTTFDFRSAFRGHLGSTFFSASMDKALRERYELAKSTLLIIGFCFNLKWKLKIPAKTWSFIEGPCLHRIVELLHFYALLRWICARPAAIIGSDKIAGGRQDFLLNQLINTSSIGDKIRNYWQSSFNKNQLDSSISQPDMKYFVQSTIDVLWPSNNFVFLFEYLISTEQYELVLELCERINSNCEDLKYCRVFMQGYALLNLDAPDKALENFRIAFKGVERGDKILIDQLVLNLSEEQRTDLKAAYFLKVAEMFERKGLSEYAIKTCEDVVRISPAVEGTLMPILNLMFKHYLRLEQYDDAFSIITKMNGDGNTQYVSLRQFIFHLQEQNLLGKLNEYDFGDLENDFLTIVESRARAVDLMIENYYDFLYAFFISRSNYRKAAMYSYEMAMRLRKEVGGLEALRRQVNALAACSQTLSEEEDTWMDRPILTRETDQSMESAGSSPKRASDGEEKEYVPLGYAKRVSMEEIECEYVLAKGNLALAERKGSYSGLLPEKELVKALIQYNLFDLAVNVSMVFDFDLVEIIESLVLRCVQSDKPRLATGLENEYWIWLGENKSICTIVSDSRSQSFPWLMLQAYLQHLSKVVPASPLYAAATRRFLSLSQIIPPWLVKEFKKIDFPELLRLLIEYDWLTEAQRLLCDYIDAVLGIAADDFNLKETLTTGKPSPVWLPFSAIDWLLELLVEKGDDAECIGLQNELEEKLKYYFHQLNAQTESMRKK